MDLQVSVCALKCCSLAPVPGGLFWFVGVFLTGVERMDGIEFCSFITVSVAFLMCFFFVHPRSAV